MLDDLDFIRAKTMRERFVQTLRREPTLEEMYVLGSWMARLRAGGFDIGTAINMVLDRIESRGK